MDRIGACGGSPTVAIADGAMGFVDQNLAVAQQGTKFVAAYENGVQEELVGLITAAGLTPNYTNWTQVLQAVTIISAKLRNLVAFTPISGPASPWIVPVGVTVIFVRAWGAGGAGGSGGGGGGGGGAAGGYAESFFVVTPGESLPFSVGQGGVGSGTAGGAVSFGSGPLSVNVGGGSAGGSGATDAVGLGGSAPGGGALIGGTSGITYTGTNGSPGFCPSSTLGVGGQGGGAYCCPGAAGSAGAISGSSGIDGTHGTLPGQGGGGGIGSGLGGQGGPGLILIYY